jgi:hypothetical protein
MKECFFMINSKEHIADEIEAILTENNQWRRLRIPSP